jgi:hypothetical protein
MDEGEGGARLEGDEVVSKVVAVVEEKEEEEEEDEMSPVVASLSVCVGLLFI